VYYFSDKPPHVVQAYIDSGEGIDRAGGFAIQVRERLPAYRTLVYVLHAVNDF
jgi:hypothetical protein